MSSVCPSVTLVDQDHICWKSWKLSPTPSFSNHSPEVEVIISFVRVIAKRLVEKTELSKPPPSKGHYFRNVPGREVAFWLFVVCRFHDLTVLLSALQSLQLVQWWAPRCVNSRRRCQDALWNLVSDAPDAERRQRLLLLQAMWSGRPSIDWLIDLLYILLCGPVSGFTSRPMSVRLIHAPACL